MREIGLPELGERESIKDVDPDVIRNAFEEHRKRHGIEQVRKDISTIIKAEDIIALSDKQVREARLKQQGQLTRRQVEERFRSMPKVRELEVKAVMALMDLRADRWAKQNGFEPSEATRDAWYATRIADVGAGDFSEPSLEQKLTGMNDVQRRDFLFGMNPIQVDTTSLGTERDAIVQGAREAYAKIVDTAVVNANDGREIKFRKRGINKILGHIGANIYDAQVVVELPSIISNGIALFSSKNNVPGDNAAYHHYGTRVKIDGEEAFVRVIVREENGDLFYDSHVTLGKEVEETLSWTSSVPQRQRNQENVSKDILLNWLAKVNNQEAGEGDLFQDTLYPHHRKQPFYDLSKATEEEVEIINRWGKVVTVRAQKTFGRGHLEAIRKYLSGYSIKRALEDTYVYAEFDQQEIDAFKAAAEVVKKYKVERKYKSDERYLYQNKRGSIEFLKDGRAVIRALEASDISTLVHEIGHIFRRDLGDNDLNVLARLGGLKDGAEFRDLEAKFWNRTATEEEAVRYRNVEETFAQGWERYLAERLAPTLELRSLFKRFTDWMLNIYKELRKEGHKVSGFEKSQIGVDIRAQVDGVSLRDIFDSLLVDKPDRPKDYGKLLERKFEDVKNTGRNWRLDDLALKRRAEKELVANILHGLESEEDARRYAEAVEYAELSDGEQIDPLAVNDALARIAEDPSLNPWARETKQLRGTTTIARGISNPNNQYDFQFKVMELDDVQASNIWVGNRLELNPEYPQELQPRERTEAQSISQVDTIARTLVPEELVYDARALDRGAPIVGPDNAVESGNGRTLAIKRAVEMYPEKYQEYKTALIENAAALGIDSAQIESMEKPVLVRERMTDTDRIKFVNDANKPIAMRMNVMEVAINDARLISDESLMNLEVGENETIEGALQAQRNTWFINRFLEKLSKNENAELSNNGIINQQGIQRIINAVFAKVYPGAAGERLLRAFSMSMSSNVKAAENAIMASLPQIARAEGLIANGARKAELSVTGDISIAVDKLANLRASNMSVSDYLGQMSYMGDDLTPNQKIMLKFISEQRQPKRIREFLREYAGLVEKEPNPNQMSLLGDMSRTKEELLNDAIKQIEPAAEGLFARELAGEPTTEAAPTVPVDELAQPIAGRPGVREEIAGGVEAGAGKRSIVLDANGNKIGAEELLALGQEQKAKYLKDLSDAAEETGFKYDPANEAAALKGINRLLEKSRTTEVVSDVLRYELTHPDVVGNYQNIIEAMQKRGYEVWRNDIDNLFDNPEPGYKHIAIKFTTGANDPVVKELQLLQPKMAEVKHKYGWDYYKIDREVKIVIESGLVDREPLENLRRDLNANMGKAYSFAFGLDNPSLAAPILAKVSIDSLESGEAPTSVYNFSRSSREALETLRSPISTSLRTSAISSTVGSLVSGIESVISRPPFDTIILQRTFDEGNPLPINFAASVGLTHTEALPEPKNVASLRNKAETFRYESRTYAREYIDWVLAGEHGQAPEAASPLIQQGVINALADSLNEMRLAALEMATAKRTSDTGIPKQGMYAAKVYRFKHGDADIVAAIYKDGEQIAYLPDNYNTAFFEVNRGQARVLGLSPDDPSAKVYEIDGEITKTPRTEENPSLQQSAPINREIVDTAKTMGITDDLLKAGYIDVDGEMLDLSNKTKVRVMQHGFYANKIYGLESRNYPESVRRFMDDTHAVRVGLTVQMGDNKLYVNLEGRYPMTSRQIDTLEDQAYKLGAKTIDITYDTHAGLYRNRSLPVEDLRSTLRSVTRGEIRRESSPVLFQESIKTDSFNSWFSWDWAKNKAGDGKSIVVDRNNEPLVVYHGTPGEIFKAFNYSEEQGNLYYDSHVTLGREITGSLAQTSSGSQNQRLRASASKDILQNWLTKVNNQETGEIEKIKGGELLYDSTTPLDATSSNVGAALRQCRWMP